MVTFIIIYLLLGIVLYVFFRWMEYRKTGVIAITFNDIFQFFLFVPCWPLGTIELIDFDKVIFKKEKKK